MAKTLSSGQIARAALVVLLGFLASGILGLIRTAAFSTAFGAADELDAFYAAQRIPELIFTLVAGGALGSSFIPVFSRMMNESDTSAWRLASAVMSLAGLIGAALATIMYVFAPQIIPSLLVPGEPEFKQALTTSLTQMMLPTVVLFTISGLTMGILNANGVFTLPALAASLYNAGQIVGAVILVPLMRADDMRHWVSENFAFLPHGLSNVPDSAIYALAYGALIGAALHLLVQLPGLHRIGASLRFLPNIHIKGVRDVLVLMGPRVLGLAVVQVNFLVNVVLTSTMVEGSRTALVTAWTLMFFALGVIAQSVGTALFPTLSALVANKDMEAYKDRLATALRSVLFMSFPATVGMILLGAPVITVLLERGEWDAQSTAATAWALTFYAIGISGHSLLEVLSRAFYALEDTWTPVAVGIFAIIANIALSLVFINVIGARDNLTQGAFGGLALANSLTTLLEGVVLWVLLRRRIGGLHDRYVLRGAFPALIAAMGMGAMVYVTSRLLDGSSAWVIAGVGTTFGAAVFFALALALKIDEARTIPNLLLRRLRRS